MEALLVIGVVIVGLLMIVFHFSRGRRVLEKWAAEQGYEILDSEYRHVRRGPFFWRTGDGHAVYHVTLRDRTGTTRHAYVRCGSWLLGVLSDHVTVEWDK